MIRLAGLLVLCAAPAGAETLRVMSFNIWGGGANEGKGIEETVAAIRAAGADVVGLQETRLESDPCTAESCPAVGESVAPAIAEALGWHVYDQTQENVALWANAVISRYPIGAVSPKDLGVALDVNGKTVWLFNIHLDDEPYQPYQLLGIEYGPAPFIKTEAEAVRHPIPGLEVLRMDGPEGEELAGKPLPTLSDTAEFAQSLVRRGVAKTVIVARGAEGNVLADKDQKLFAKAAKVRVKSTVGAGDSFVAAFVLALAQGQTNAEALALGSAAASAAVTTDATQLCRPEDVMRLLRECTVSAV